MKRSISILLVVVASFLAEASVLASAKLVAAGREGAFYVSTNDGKQWRRVRSGVSSYLYDVTSDNRGAFVAVGANGVILRSTNYGKSWKKIASGVPSSLSAVTFDEVSDRMVVVGAKGVILRSDDQGKSWTKIVSGSDAPLYGVATDGAGAWVAVGTRGQVVVSSDEAETFSPAESPTHQQLNDLVFAKGHFVAAGVGGTVLSSGDGGASWISGLTGFTLPFEGVAVDRMGNILAVGWKGSIYRSDNGGESWSAVSSGTTERLFDVTPFGEQGFVITGDRGLTLRSENGGATWAPVKKRNGRKMLETVDRARLPNLGVKQVSLDETCALTVTLVSTGPARLPAEAWDGRVKIGLLLPKGLVKPLSLGDLDPERKLLVPASELTVKIPGASIKAKASTAVKLVIDVGKKLTQVTRADDRAQAQVSCQLPAAP